MVGATLLRLFLLLSFHSALTFPQQVGSFFTAIYLNGAPVASSQTSCAEMGQADYCCVSGQSCAWDDGGKVACCASGTNCQGTAYSSGAYNQGAGAGAGQYYTSPTSSWYPQQQTTTIYQSESEGCNCESTTNYGGVVPIVPVTEATVLTSYSPSTTSYYNPPTSTYYPVTTTTTPAVVVAEVTTSNNAACPSGYKTFTEANVGAPVRTVGCNVIYDSGAERGKGMAQGMENEITIMIFMAMSFTGVVLAVL